MCASNICALDLYPPMTVMTLHFQASLQLVASNCCFCVKVCYLSCISCLYPCSSCHHLKSLLLIHSQDMLTLFFLLIWRTHFHSTNWFQCPCLVFSTAVLTYHLLSGSLVCCLLVHLQKTGCLDCTVRVSLLSFPPMFVGSFTTILCFFVLFHLSSLFYCCWLSVLSSLLLVLSLAVPGSLAPSWLHFFSCTQFLGIFHCSLLVCFLDTILCSIIVCGSRMTLLFGMVFLFFSSSFAAHEHYILRFCSAVPSLEDHYSVPLLY